MKTHRCELEDDVAGVVANDSTKSGIIPPNSFVKPSISFSRAPLLGWRMKNKMKELKREKREKVSWAGWIREGGDTIAKDGRTSSSLPYQRQVSLSDTERAVLSALFVDNEQNEFAATAGTPIAGAADETEEALDQAQQEFDGTGKDEQDFVRKLDNDVLFSIPAPLIVPLPSDSSDIGEGYDENDKMSTSERRALIPPNRRRDSSFHIGLWRAHEDGVSPFLLRELYRTHSSRELEKEEEEEGEKHRTMPPGQKEGRVEAKTTDQQGREHELEDEAEESTVAGGASITAIADPNEDLDADIASDESVKDDDDNDSASSWDIEEGGFDHFDAWQVLKDEYAADFGYLYRDSKPAGEIDSTDEGKEGSVPVSRRPSGGMEVFFKILGTSADDVDSQPHVLSPPLMESLLQFVPEHLGVGNNLWLRYSLVRDGASIITLRELCQHAQYTFLALETTTGDVFGSFTCTPWRKSWKYFGTGEAFLWKMRHSRRSPCHSVLEQAELESVIDVFPFSGLNYYVQLCTNDKLAIGGGALEPQGNGMILHESEFTPEVFEDLRTRAERRKELAAKRADYIAANPPSTGSFGFGIAVNSDLLFGTSSPCATFRNPSLSSHSDGEDVFEIVNLEVWSFTPCETVEAAENLEEMKSVRLCSSTDSSYKTSSSPYMMASNSSLHGAPSSLYGTSYR